MKIRNLLLGSIAAAGLSAGGAQAADLGVLTSLDVCDSLGLTGLTISSDAACVQVSGEVSYAYTAGDFNANQANATDEQKRDAKSTLSSKLKVVATSDSSFGKTSGTIVLKDVKEGTIENGGAFTVGGDDTGGVIVDEAYLSIGDSTVIAAGKKGSVYNDGQDAPLTWLNLFKSSDVDTGVSSGSTATGGTVMQITSDLGNGLSLAGGLEDLTGKGTLVGVLAYSSDTVSGHVSVAKGSVVSGANADDDWKVHAGFTGTFNNFKFVFADAISKDKFNALVSASATFDMFTLAVGYEVADNDYSGYGASVGFTVSEGVTINLGGRWNDNNGVKKNEIAAGLTAAIAENLSLSGKVGSTHEDGVADDVSYGEAGLTWSPGGGFTSSVTGTVYSNDQYKIKTEFKKSF